MLSVSQSTSTQGKHADRRFIRPSPASSPRFPSPHPRLTNKHMKRHSTPEDLHFLSKLSNLRRKRRPAIDSESSPSTGALARFVHGAIRKCVQISFQVFKIVDTFGCGTLDKPERLVISGEKEISLVKENKVLNFKIESHEFKNELQLTDIYYERVQRKLERDNGRISTKPSENLSQDFFSTTRELTSKKNSSGFISKRELSVSHFQTPNKASKKVFSSSMKKIGEDLPMHSSFYCKNQQIIGAIPRTMKIDSPSSFPNQTRLIVDSRPTRQQKLFPKSLLGSVKKILFTNEDIQSDAENQSHVSEDLSLQFSTSDALSFMITRNTPAQTCSFKSGYSQKSESKSNSQKLSWLSLFTTNILSFEKNPESGFIWTIDSRQKFKITDNAKALQLAPEFDSLHPSTCKWISANVLVCADQLGRVMFGKIERREKLVWLETWQVSDDPIRNIRSCGLQMKISCLDTSGRLWVFSLKRVLNWANSSGGEERKRVSDLRVRNQFANVVQSQFHPKKPSILAMIQNIQKNEISVFNLSTKQLLLRKRFKSAVHSFCFHEHRNILFVGLTRGNSHSISILHLSPNFQKTRTLGRLGLRQSHSPFKNLQMNHGLLVATTANQKLFIWKQDKFGLSGRPRQVSSGLVCGSKLFR